MSDTKMVGGIIVGRVTREDWPEFDNSNGQALPHRRRGRCAREARRPPRSND